jgi:hypothetical protein
VLVVLGVALLAAVVAGVTLALRSPGGSGGGNGGPGFNSGSFSAATRPPVTAEMLSAVRRDEVRMLRLLALPPGAQRLAHEPPLFQRRGVEIFGEIPIRSTAFTRFGYWRVRSSVAAVMSFVKAHPPLGARPINGYGWNSSPKVPTNRDLLIAFQPIHRLVSDRIMRVYIVRQAGGWTAIRAVATNHPWHPYRFPHGTDRQEIFFLPAHHQPIAGHTFTGITVIDENPRVDPLVGVSCGGVLGNQPLPGQQHVFSTAPPPGEAGALARFEKVNKVEELTCTWQIPAGSTGKRLEAGNTSRHGGSARRVGARLASNAAYESAAHSWIVQP